MLPRLDFAEVIRGKEKWPWDLTIFLHPHSLQVSKPHRLKRILQGDFGKPRKQRLRFVQKVHEVLEADLAGGGSYATLDSRMRAFLFFFRFCDEQSIDPNLAPKALLATFQRWVAHDRSHAADVSGRTLYYRVNSVATILARAAGMRVREFMVAVSMSEPPRHKPVLPPSEDRRRLEDTSNFVAHLVELIANLTQESISGPLPITLRFSSGAQYLHYSRRLPPEKLRSRVSKQSVVDRMRQRERLTPASKPFDRRPVINLRIEAELLHFIAQTGINLSQALNYSVGDFSYSSHLDGYQVRRRYKGRRKGEVEFEIFSEYRPHFEAYLRWRKLILEDPGDTRLFPFLGKPRIDHHKSFATRDVFRAISVPFVSPQKLRDVRVNWLDRHAKDPAIAATMSQHAVQTLITRYRRPDHAKAATDLTSFWRKSDPALEAAGPGKCSGGQAEAVPDAPVQAPRPDCLGAGGCLFCFHHRDVRSLDYVWSLASFRHLKSLELSKQRVSIKGASPPPTQVVMERITKKLQAMEAMGERFVEWVKEAHLRVREEHFHPDWADLITLAERA